MNAKKPKAYSYIRFSSERQKLGDSLRRQLSMARQWAEDHNVELDDKTFRDLGVSGFDRSNETAALGAFLTAAQNGQVASGSYFLVENLDRLSRAGVIPTINIIQQLVEAGITVVLLADNGREFNKESINDLTGIIMAVVYAARAHDESLQKSRRVKASRAARRQQIINGEPIIMSSECPGWLRANKTKTGFEGIPEKVESVRKVFQYTIEGFGNVAIMKIANREKWPVPGRAKDWHQSLISKIAANRAVLGEYQPRTKQDGVMVPVGDPIQNYYPRIIDEELFLRARGTKERNRTVARRRDNQYLNLFFGILKCQCGATYTRKVKVGPSIKLGYHLWMCADRVRSLTQCPSWSGRDEYRLDVSLLRALAQHHFGHISAQEKASNLRTKIETLEAQRDEASTQIKRVIDTLTEIGTSSALTQRLRDLEEKLARLEEDLEVSRAAIHDLSRASGDTDHFQLVDEMLRNLDSDDPEAIKYRSALAQRIRSAVDAIYVFQEQSMAAIFWRGNEETKVCQWVPLRPSADINAALKGRLKLPKPRTKNTVNVR